MVTFEQAELSNDLTRLDRQVSVEAGEWIDSVYVEYFPNRNTTGAPSDKALKVWSAPEGQKAVYAAANVDESQLTIEGIGTNTFVGGLFYILVHWEDEENDYYDVAAVFDWDYVYNLGMAEIRKFVHDCGKRHCDIPEYFEQLILVVHALELAVEARDLDMIDTLWTRFLNLSAGANVSHCNCR